MNSYLGMTMVHTIVSYCSVIARGIMVILAQLDQMETLEVPWIYILYL